MYLVITYWDVSLKIIVTSRLITSYIRASLWSSGSVLGHRLLPPIFESRCEHTWRLFHLYLRFITFGGGSAHVACYVHKTGCKISIIISITSYDHHIQTGAHCQQHWNANCNVDSNYRFFFFRLMTVHVNSSSIIPLC